MFTALGKKESQIPPEDYLKILALRNDPRSEPRLSLLRASLIDAIHFVKSKPVLDMRKESFPSEIAGKMQNEVIRCEVDFQLGEKAETCFKEAIYVALSYLKHKTVDIEQEFWDELPPSRWRVQL